MDLLQRRTAVRYRRFGVGLFILLMTAIFFSVSDGMARAEGLEIKNGSSRTIALTVGAENRDFKDYFSVKPGETRRHDLVAYKLSSIEVGWNAPEFVGGNPPVVCTLIVSGTEVPPYSKLSMYVRWERIKGTNVANWEKLTCTDNK